MRVDRLFLIFSVFVATIFFAGGVLAATNISSNSAENNAWNDNIGWINFYSSGNAYVYPDRLEGYANSAIGAIALNCNSTPNGNVCAGPAGNWKVSNSGGALSGWAWNDAIGWISFDSATAGSGFFYQVVINGATGEFSGWAWNDDIGWISFNCANTGTCGSSDYKVKTGWNSNPISGYLLSSVFDSQVAGGSTINSITWNGAENGGAVKFWVASSDSASGSWVYLGPGGTSADNDYYSAGSGVAMPVNFQNHANDRYFRYKVVLESDASQLQSPVINEIIINWSP